MELVEEVKKTNPEIPIVILTAQNDLKMTVKILKEGAFDFIVKDENALQRIVTTLKNVIEIVKLKEDIALQKLRSKKDMKRLIFLFVVALLLVLGFVLLV